MDNPRHAYYLWLNLSQTNYPPVSRNFVTEMCRVETQENITDLSDPTSIPTFII